LEHRDQKPRHVRPAGVEPTEIGCHLRVFTKGRIMLSADAQFPWVWTLTYGYHEDRTPTHGYELTREAAMKAFAWHRET
jgi:hypothetical protein